TINVVSDVIENFETIIQDTTVIEEITNLVVNDIVNQGDIYNEIINLIEEHGGNVYYDGENSTYIDENGDTHVININDLFDETVTTLVNEGEGVYVYTNEEEVPVTINVVSYVIGYCETSIQDPSPTEQTTDLVVNDIVNQGDIYNEIINLIEENG